MEKAPNLKSEHMSSRHEWLLLQYFSCFFGFSSLSKTRDLDKLYQRFVLALTLYFITGWQLYCVTWSQWKIEWWNSVIRIPEMHFKLWKCKLLEGRDQLYLLLVSLPSSVVHLAHSRHSINIYWLKQSCAQYPWDICYDFCLNINLFFYF